MTLSGRAAHLPQSQPLVGPLALLGMPRREALHELAGDADHDLTWAEAGHLLGLLEGDRAVVDHRGDGRVFGFGTSIFFIGYFLFEIPSNIILHKVGARRWMIGWIIDRTHSADLGVYALAAILSVGSLLVLTIPGRIVNR